MSLTGSAYGHEEGDIKVETKEAKEDVTEISVQRIRKAATLVYEGHPRRAVRGLASEGVPSITQRTIDNLKNLHPQGPSKLPRCPQEAPEVLRIDKDKVKDIIKRELANGSAPARSGWTGDLLKALIDDEQCLDGLTTMTMSIANGRVKGRAKALLLSSVLIGLDKPNGGTRPIAMGEVFYKLAATYMLKLVNEPARQVLGPSQFAFAPGGAEAAVTCLRLALDEHPQWSVLACDLKNAFNARDRGDILKILYQHQELAPVWRLAHWAYGAPSDLLVVDRGKLVEVIKSTQGVKQGDTLSSLLFALSMTGIYARTAERAGVRAIAVQDDIYFLGPISAVTDAWEQFKKEIGEKTGLKLNVEKTGLLVPVNEQARALAQKGLRPSDTLIPALGTILTRDLRILGNWLHKEMMKTHTKMFQSITSKHMPTQVAFTLLRMCMVPAVQYWVRTAPPEATAKMAEEFDEKVMRAAAKILDIEQLSTEAKYQLKLPVARGGFGLRSMAQARDAAWVATMAQSVQFCNTLRQSHRLQRSVATPLECCIERLNTLAGREVIPGKADEMWQKYLDTPGERGIQKELMAQIIEREHQTYLESDFVQHNLTRRVRWTALTNKDAGLWLTTIPTQQVMRLTDGHFRTAARIRLVLPPHNHLRSCSCGVHFERQPQHLLSCRSLLAMNTVRHNIVRDTLIRFAATVSTPTVREPIIDYKDAVRGDVTFYFRERPAVIDVSIVNPLAGSYETVASDALAVAEKMEKEKERKYGERVRETRNLFFPFVMEATGGFGARTGPFLEKFVEDIKCGGGLVPIQGNITNYIKRLTSIALCRGNGLLCQEGIK